MAKIAPFCHRSARVRHAAGQPQSRLAYHRRPEARRRRRAALAAHAFHLSKTVVLATLGRVTVQTAVLFALLRLLDVHSPFAREALVCCSFPLATITVLLAAKYKAMEAESASALLLSTLSLVVTVPIIVSISR